MKSFLQALRTTLGTVFHDRAAIATLVGGTILYSFYYPAPYSHQVASRLPVVVVDLDRSSASRALLRKVNSVRAVRLIGARNSIPEAEFLVTRGRAEGILVVTADFERDILRGRPGRIALFADGARLGHGGTAVSGLADAIAGLGPAAVGVQAKFLGAPPAPPIRLLQRPLFNTREGYGSAVVPAASGVIIHQILFFAIVLLIGTRQEAGRLALSGAELAGVSAAFGLIGISIFLYFNGFVFWFQDYPRAGNFGGLIVTGLLYVSAIIAFALFVGSFFFKRERSFQVLPLTSLPFFFLADTSWPRPATPVALTWIAKLLPSTAGIDVMVKFNQMGARFPEAFLELANLALLVLLYGSLAAWRYGRAPVEETHTMTVGTEAGSWT